MIADRRRLCACGLMFIPNGSRQTRCNACRFPVEQPVSASHRYCTRCGKLFAPRAARDVYCSLTCRQARLPTDRACAICGAVFHPVTNQRYCATCGPLYSTHARRHVVPMEKVCEMCGKAFVPKRRDRAVCGAACRQRRWFARQPKGVRDVSAESTKTRLVRFDRVLQKHGMKPSQEKTS